MSTHGLKAACRAERNPQTIVYTCLSGTIITSYAFGLEEHAYDVSGNS